MKGVSPKPLPERDRRLDDTRSTAGSGNVFVDLGFDDGEARVMAVRVQLMMRLRERLQDKAIHGSKPRTVRE